MQEIETTLYHLPKPSKQHLDHLEGLLNKVRAEQGIMPKDVRAREEAAKRVDAFLKNAVNGRFAF